jgi:hypothetical protein
LALLLFSALLTGCFFDHPLTDKPSKNINTWLLGVWEYRDAKGKVYRAGVLPMTGSRYTVWFRALGKSSREIKEWQFEAWISRVGNSSFLTMKCLKTAGEVPEGAFVFAHYQVINQNNVQMRALQLDSSQDTSSYHLRSEVRVKMKEKTLLPQQGMLWTRVSEIYWPRDGDGEQPFQPLRFPPGPPLIPLDVDDQ